ncbi:c-type cytochrome [Profundibacterium mesophilum]|uniref:Diheme cytochrome c-type n=1 Tax=Profundibacterium mesophilum KAUST100406-0324 TaxID=1037889 RepID=A0A921NVX3_9RHOB|nr:c-type cytochrome [Profundibacterium mesophilum]KAF0675759.1 Diheme cytochrome c-type [Profundibacterium mesophilum KAUST100406-0324]
MRKIAVVLSSLAALGAAGLAAVIVWPIGRDVAPITLVGDADRGAYLARAGGCIACHTDVEGGGAPLAGGAPLKTDFGIFHPPNLTTDPQAGIGAWSVEDFARALRQGISPNGQPYYPSFPYPFYARLSDQDIADLWAAFQTVPAASGAAPAHELAFPFDQRWGLKIWRAAYLAPPPTTPVEGRSAVWNRGRWLVEGVAHCAACHTGRNFAGARVPALNYEGARNLPGGGTSPAITSDALREKGYDAGSLAYALKTGIMPDGDVFGASMGEVVNYGTAFLSDADRAAMATYLLDMETSR